MKNIFKLFSRIKLTQDLTGFLLFENFLTTAVLTILGVRFFLRVSGYPQIGGAGFHIAHMLWGGLILFACLLVIFLFLDRRVKAFAAVFGGVGFGLFIDELGKFITSDNNYFFQPTIAIIYIFCVLLFLLMHILKSHMRVTKDEFVSNALDIFRNSLVHGLTDQERDEADNYLKSANAKFSLDDLYELTKEKEFDRKITFTFFPNVRDKINTFINRLATNRAFQIIVITLIEFQAIFSFLLLIFVVLVVFGRVPEIIRDKVVLELDFASTAAIFSSFVAGLLAIVGAFSFARSKKRAFYLIKYCLFISIFIVQFFIFWIDQFGGIIGLVFDVIALQTVNVILEKRVEN